MARHSLAEIRASYAQKRDWERQYPFCYFLSRPFSFYLTYVVLFITDSPSRVAWFGFALGLLGCAALAGMSHLTIWPGLLLLGAFCILDAVDGNIARVTGNVTYYGRFLDGILGTTIEASYCFWLGLGLYLDPGGPYAGCLLPRLGEPGRVLPVLAGAAVMWGALYGGRIEAAYDRHLSDKQAQEGPVPSPGLAAAIGSSSYRKHWWYLVLINFHSVDLQFALLAIAAALGATDLFLLVFAAYYLFRASGWFVYYVRRAQQRLV